ncbi:hypothetical protein LSH36_232g04041 [Paralvinella palmiformis]|uniref:Uncharacterized protein n=1 Tax=Paralvinella palmiformis TaxID=53620 RepID=A0AAD9N5I7_9ANNE|nr:hypothetical protein LSH36_232g04041 [Paralvinella palmiformis]
MYSRLARDAGFNPTSRILTFTKCDEVVTIYDRSNAEDKETFTLFVKKAAILYGVSVLAKFRDVPHNININIYEKLDSEIIKICYTNKGITSVRKSSVFAQFNRNIPLLPGSSYLITAVPPKDSNLCPQIPEKLVAKRLETHLSSHRLHDNLVSLPYRSLYRDRAPEGPS